MAISERSADYVGIWTEKPKAAIPIVPDVSFKKEKPAVIMLTKERKM